MRRNSCDFLEGPTGESGPSSCKGRLVCPSIARNRGEVVTEPYQRLSRALRAQRIEAGGACTCPAPALNLTGNQPVVGPFFAHRLLLRTCRLRPWARRSRLWACRWAAGARRPPSRLHGAAPECLKLDDRCGPAQPETIPSATEKRGGEAWARRHRGVHPIGTCGDLPAFGLPLAKAASSPLWFTARCNGS